MNFGGTPFNPLLRGDLGEGSGQRHTQETRIGGAQQCPGVLLRAHLDGVPGHPPGSDRRTRSMQSDPPGTGVLVASGDTWPGRRVWPRVAGPRIWAAWGPPATEHRLLHRCGQAFRPGSLRSGTTAQGGLRTAPTSPEGGTAGGRGHGLSAPPPRRNATFVLPPPTPLPLPQFHPQRGPPSRLPASPPPSPRGVSPPLQAAFGVGTAPAGGLGGRPLPHTPFSAAGAASRGPSADPANAGWV